MAESDDDLPVGGTVGERVVRIEERLKQAKKIADKAEIVALEVKGKVDELARLWSEFKDLKPDVLLVIQQAYENEEADKREFDKAVKVAVITLIVSVIGFSIIVPILQHALFH